MKREDLEEVVRLAAAAADDVIVVVGSQAILAEVPDPPAELLISMEVDLYPLNHTDRADLIDAMIGEETAFARERGYWAHGIGPEAVASAPTGWEGRCVVLSVQGFRRGDPIALAQCMSKVDLVLTKLGAGREKDIRYAEAAVRHGVVSVAELRDRLDLIPETVAWDSNRNPRKIATDALAGIEQRAARS